MTQDKWFAVGLINGATQPAKDYWVEQGPRKNNPGRYLRHKVSSEMNVTRAAKLLDIEVYIPTVLQVRLHSRTKRPIFNYTPSIPYFAFIRGVTDFQKIEAVKYFGEVLGQNGAPVPIPEFEMFILQKEEEKQHLEEQERFGLERIRRASAYLKERRQRHLPRAKLAQLYPSGVQICIKDGPYAGQTATVKEATGRQSVKAMMQLLGSLVPVEIPVAQIDQKVYNVA